jgi:hypothetical protein
VASHEPGYIAILSTREDARRGASVSDAVLFRVLDSSGISVRGIEPKITVLAGGGQVVDVVSRSRLSPGVFGATLRMGTRGGANSFRIEAGGISREFTIIAP